MIFHFYEKECPKLTEEEKSINQNAEGQDTEKEEQDTTFDVVMPEANRVVMDKEEVKEQPEYLKTFANFYIAHFDQDDLEIMNLFDNSHNTVDINKYLLDNINFPRKKLIDHVLHTHDYNFKNLLKEIAKEDVDPENMTTFEDWDSWYENRRAKIEGSLS